MCVLCCVWHTPLRPGYTQTVPGEGMPNPKDPTGKTRGDLIIEFDIVFPKVLSAAQKQLLQKALGK